MYIMRKPQENKRMQESREQLGFTLIEVLTVAAMIGILASMAVVSMRGGRRIAFETRAIAAMKNIGENEAIYYGRYRIFGSWLEMRKEGDLIDPGYEKVDDLDDPNDTPIANLYSIYVFLPAGRQCFTAFAMPHPDLPPNVWNLRTYAVDCDGGIMNSTDQAGYFSVLPGTP